MPSAEENILHRLGRVEEMMELLISPANSSKRSDDNPYGIQADRSEVHKDKAQEAEASLRTPRVHIGRTPDNTTTYESLASQLMAAWPSQRDLDHILSLPTSFSGLVTGSTSALYAGISDQDAPSPKDTLQLPPLGSHPVLIARKLLLLGSYLQRIRPSSVQEMDSISVCHLDDIMSRVVETCHDLVTCHDDLVFSAEGIECIMIESSYHNNAGNLRRSWVATRRAITIAQLMGLHRENEPWSAPKLLQPATTNYIDPTKIWFRLIMVDRYLSLMLGLPLGYLENDFADPKILKKCSPLERMERLQAVATARILQNNQAGRDDLSSVQEIDALLHDASGLMPPRWWLPPSPEDDVQVLCESARVLDLINHSYLLVRLHLPYLLRFSTDRMYDYSKITAVNASRDVVAWFLSYRSSSLTRTYCRGTDFMVFIASTTMCIAHIEARRQRQISPRKPATYSVFDYLVHQRLSDRAMIEQTLECMQMMAHDGTDKVTSKISSILNHLLDIEADASTGESYNIKPTKRVVSRTNDGLECDGDISDGGYVLRIYIPYFGTIVVERGGLSESQSGDLDKYVKDKSQTSPALGYQLGGEPASPDWQIAPFCSPLNTFAENSQPTVYGNSGTDPSVVHGLDEEALEVPGLTTSVDDWALQGADMAFFGSLFWGNTTGDYTL